MTLFTDEEIYNCTEKTYWKIARHIVEVKKSNYLYKTVIIDDLTRNLEKISSAKLFQE